MQCHHPCYYQQMQQPNMVVDVNTEIINERERLRGQLFDLEERYQIDIEELKVNLLAESERILQKQLTDQANSYEAQLRQKESILAQQHQRIQILEQENARLFNCNNVLTQTVIRKKEKIKFLKDEMATIRQAYETKLADQENYWRTRIAQELAQLEEELNQKFDIERHNYDDQIRRLKVLCAQFEEKYKEILAELERIKNLLNDKQRELEEWAGKYHHLEKRLEIDQGKVSRKSNISPSETRHLEHQIELLKQEILMKDQKLKKQKQKPQQQQMIQCPPQQIIIEKPIERIVEVEKIVPVERIIRERLPSRQPVIVQQQCNQVGEDYKDRYKELKVDISEFKRANLELNNQLMVLRQEYDIVVNDRDQLKHEFDILLSKVRELEDILKNKNRDLYDRISQINNSNRQRDDDKIIVHVNSGKGNKQSHVFKR